MENSLIVSCCSMWFTPGKWWNALSLQIYAKTWPGWKPYWRKKRQQYV